MNHYLCNCGKKDCDGYHWILDPRGYNKIGKLGLVLGFLIGALIPILITMGLKV